MLESKTFSLSLDRIDADTFLELEAMCKRLSSRPDLIHFSSYKMEKKGLQIVRELKEMGLKVVAVTNASIPIRHRLVIEQEAGVEITQLFDLFVTSNELEGKRMPDPEFIRNVLASFPDVALHEAFLVGDKLDRSLASGKGAGIRTVLYASCKHNRETNCKALAHGHHPDFTILDYTQIQYVLEVMARDTHFIKEAGLGIGQYR